MQWLWEVCFGIRDQLHKATRERQLQVIPSHSMLVLSAESSIEDSEQPKGQLPNSSYNRSTPIPLITSVIPSSGYIRSRKVPYCSFVSAWLLSARCEGVITNAHFKIAARNFPTLNVTRWGNHRCYEGFQCTAVVKWTGKLPLGLFNAISLQYLRATSVRWTGPGYA